MIFVAEALLFNLMCNINIFAFVLKQERPHFQKLNEQEVAVTG